MTFRFKRPRHAIFLFLPAILLAIGGCSSNSTSNSGNSNNVLQNGAASFLAARSFDRAKSALEKNDVEKLKAATQDLKISAQKTGDSLLIVAPIVLIADDAVNQERLAVAATGAEKTRLQEIANEKYRIALALLPSDYQKIAELDLDNVTLNTLGYFLADRGQKLADFQLAEFLTGAALAQLNRFEKSLPQSDPRLPALLYSRAVGAGDSKAWALFKQKRYPQARSELEEVLRIANEYGPQIKERLSPEIPYHLAEIYLAMGEITLAESSYDLALSLAPDEELKAKMEARLSAIKNSLPG